MYKLLTLIVTAVILYIASTQTNQSAQRPEAHHYTPTKELLAKNGLFSEEHNKAVHKQIDPEETRTQPEETKTIVKKADTSAEPIAAEVRESIKEEPMTGNFLEKSLSKVLVNTLKTQEGRALFEAIIQPDNKNIAPNQTTSLAVNNSANMVAALFQPKTIIEGTGPVVSCGHIVDITFQITNSQNVVIEEGKKTIRLGGGKVIPGLENMIIGMKIGEKRTAYIPAQYAYESFPDKFPQPKQPSPYYNATVKLESALPKIYASGDKVKIFDDQIGYSMPYLCGNHVVFDVKISSFDGVDIYDSKRNGTRIAMFLGDTKHPFIFSIALFNKVPVGTRTVICKGKYLDSSFDKNVNVILDSKQINPEQLYMIEFSNFKPPN